MKKILSAITILALYHGALAATIITDYSMQPYDQFITTLYSKLKAGSITPRIKQISSVFMNKPYLNGALGEGKTAQFDQSPLYRTDAFDCVTYVSTVLALAKSNNLPEFKNNIVRINYRSAKPKFETRNHFMSVDWNIVNEHNGYIKDVTFNVIGDNGAPIARVATAVIDKPNWMKKLPGTRLKLIHNITEVAEQQLLKKLHDLSTTVKAQEAVLPYLPLNKLFTNGIANPKLFAQIPDGSIIEIVRPNWDLTELIGTHMLVSHVGLAIRTADGLMFREASLEKNKVVDVPLAAYLKNYLTSPTIKGINVQAIE